MRGLLRPKARFPHKQESPALGFKKAGGRVLGCLSNGPRIHDVPAVAVPALASTAREYAPRGFARKRLGHNRQVENAIIRMNEAIASALTLCPPPTAGKCIEHPQNGLGRGDLRGPDFEV